MQSQAPIQTNHGVTYPLVGPKLIEQAALISEQDEPAVTVPAAQNHETRTESANQSSTLSAS